VTPSSSIERRAKGRFAPFGPPLMSNVRPSSRPVERGELRVPFYVQSSSSSPHVATHGTQEHCPTSP